VNGDRRFELALGRILAIGIALSSVCLGTGLLLTLAGSGGSLSWDLLALGLVVLIATPAARVVASSIGYAIRRDWIFLALTLIVFAELAGSLYAAVYGRWP
jgi:uncharacterized membrane protein